MAYIDNQTSRLFLVILSLDGSNAPFLLKSNLPTADNPSLRAITHCSWVATIDFKYFANNFQFAIISRDSKNHDVVS